MVSKEKTITMLFRCFRIALFIGAFIVGGVTGEYAGASEKERVSKLIEGARSEGKMVLYTTMTVMDSSSMIKKFNEKYPFVKIEFYMAPSDTLQMRIINEARARKYIPDVIEMTGFNAYVINKEHIYASYLSPESRVIKEGFKDPEGNWTSNYYLPFVMGYNTKLLSRKDIPDTYEGFLHPKWKGKIGFDTKEVEWFANMLKIMGEERGMDFFRKFVAQDLHKRRVKTLIRDLIIAGEFPLGTAYPHQMESRKKKGAKVDWVGVSPVIAKLGTTGLAAHASHPNAAKLYIDFCLSREGQMALVDLERLPARPDIETDELKVYKGLKIYPSDISLAEKYVAYSRQFAELLR